MATSDDIDAGIASDEPGRAFDEECSRRRMSYYLSQALRDAADNEALDADIADLMSALAVAHRWCRAEDPELCRLFVDSVRSLARFLGFRNALNDRVRWGEAALEVAELLSDELIVAELCASTMAWPLLQLGDYASAERYCRLGLEAAVRCGDSPAGARWAGNAARSLSGIARDAGEGPEAQRWAEQAMMYAKRCGDEALARGAQLDFGYAALLEHDFEAAERLFTALLNFEEQGSDQERIGNRSGDAALAIMNRALRCRDPVEREQLCNSAGANIKRSLRIAKQIRHAVLIGECEISLATLARIRGNDAEYRRLMDSGHSRFAHLGIRRKGRAEQFVFFAE